MKKSLIQKVLISLWGVVGLYVLVGFFYPIVPITKDTTLLSWWGYPYRATWTQVYVVENTFSPSGKDVKTHKALPWVNPWNSKLVWYDVLLTKDAVYFQGNKVEWADPFTLKKVSYNLGSYLSKWYDTQIIQYLYDDNNVYLGSNSIVLPRDGKPADVVYAQYRLGEFEKS